MVLLSFWCLWFIRCLIILFSVQSGLKKLSNVSLITASVSCFYSKKTVLSSKQEGHYKMDDLRRQGEHLCEQETLEKVQKQKIHQSVKVVEEEWRSLLQTAEAVLNKAQTEADTQEQFDSFKSQIEDVQMWIRDQKKKVMSTSSHMPFDERLQIVKVK